MLDHFKFLKKHCDTAHVTAKMTIPSPAVLHFRGGRKAISKDIYPDLEPFFEDLGKTYRKAVKAFYDAGCRYLQFDDTAWAYLCSDVEMKKAKERGMNVATMADDYTRVINDSIKDKPADMVITTHVCRGNFRSTWISSGGYEPVAERMLGQCNYDGYFLEYDSERSGDFRPLRHVPKEKSVVLGLVSSKTPVLEDPSELKRRIDAAAAFVPHERLALSPQCGFGTTVGGAPMSEDDQRRKLALVGEVARQVWG
jgi:5-methyltetrahydropteroyltriglutamate--homocysteine methyltransferase